MEIKVLVSGRVQGVGFRFWVKKSASKYGVVGWVKNLADGRVEARLSGDDQLVKKVLDRIKKGPPLSRVDQVETEEKDDLGQVNNFAILR